MKLLRLIKELLKASFEELDQDLKDHPDHAFLLMHHDMVNIIDPYLLYHAKDDDIE